MVLPLLSQILVIIGNSKSSVNGNNIQILGGCGCRDLDLVEQVH